MRNSWQNIEIVPAGRLTMIPSNIAVTSLQSPWEGQKPFGLPLQVAEGELMLLICKTLDIHWVLSKEKKWTQIKSWCKWICGWKRFSGGALAPTFQDWAHQCIPLLGEGPIKHFNLLLLRLYAKAQENKGSPESLFIWFWIHLLSKLTL